MIENISRFTLAPLRVAMDPEAYKIVRLALAIFALTVWMPCTLLGLGLIAVQYFREPSRLPIPPEPIKLPHTSEALPPPVSAEPPDEFEEMEKVFWENCFSKEHFAQVMLILATDLKNEEKAEILVQTVTGDQDPYLQKCVYMQLACPNSKRGGGQRTKGDGSCAFHALLGEPIDGVYQCNGNEKRKQFVDWLRSASSMPDPIREQLAEYRTNIELLRRVNPSLARVFETSTEEAEILEAYYTYIGTEGVWLTDMELEAAAMCFDRKVELRFRYNSEEFGNRVLNERGSSVVKVFYQFGHYERDYP